MKQIILWFIVGTFVAIIAFMASNYTAYGQGTENLAAQPVSNESVKIVSPTDGQQVPLGEELIASGESSDDISKDCTVSVIVNNIKPYHAASATGGSGSGDYSKWSFTLSSNYTDIMEGRNRITAKLSCPEYTKWYSVNAIGVRTGQASESTNVSSNFTPSVLGAINETGTLSPQPEQRVSSTPPPSSEVNSQPAASAENTTRTMSVIFDILNNPVSRGGDQNITITVSDAASNESIPGATITGKLLYPGDNYVKDFSGTTDLNGQFVYHWTIGKNGDAGELTIEVQVAALGYESQTATSAFEIIKR
ncbi:MAG: hypothetical protein ABJB85_07015 [Nitrososphaerota archaeon]